MRAGGQISLAMGVLVMGMLLLVACGSSRALPTSVAASGSPTPPLPTAGVPSTATVTSSPVALPTSAVTATATVSSPTLFPSPTVSATIGTSPTPLPTAIAQGPLVLTDIRMITPEQGWATGVAASALAVGQSPPPVGSVFQTADGGATWQNVSPPGVSPESTNAAFFLDASNGWIAASTPVTPTGSSVSATLTVYGTIDGGQSWRRGNPFTVSGGGAATPTFVDALHGWMMIGLYAADGSEAVEIAKTVDGGLNWEPISLAAESASQSTGGSLPYRCDKNGLTFVDAATGWAAGTCPKGTLFLYVTQDGGQTWQPQTPPPPPGDPATLFSNCDCAVEPPLFTSAQDGVLAITVSQINQGSYLYVTRDGGFTWAVRELPVAELYGPPDFFDANDGVVTDGERIFDTTDGGQTWTQLGTLPISTTNLVGGIDFVDMQNGWVTDGQQLYATHDGSQTWSTSTPMVVPSSPARPAAMTVTLADDGQTITLQVDEEFLLDLGGQYTWTVTIDNPAIVGRVVSLTPVKGAQGTYEALRSGTATLSATGEPICRQAQPPCATPSRQFLLNIVVQ